MFHLVEKNSNMPRQSVDRTILIQNGDNSPIDDEDISLPEKANHLHQSRALPRALFLPLAFIFRVPVHDKDRCIGGKVLHAFTALIALGYWTINMVYNIYDIKSTRTKQTVTIGLVDLVLSTLWCAISVYANQLGHRLLSSVSVRNSLRLHSKTVFKIPAVILVGALAISVVVLTNYRWRTFWDVGTCNKVSLNVWVCRVSYLLLNLQAVLTLIFNLFVAASVLSICRTHTIGVRRFIRDLENDGKACEIKHRERFTKLQFAASTNLNDLYLPEHLYERDDDSEDDLRIHADPTTITAASSSAAAMPVTSRRTSLPTLEENRVPTYAQSRQRTVPNAPAPPPDSKILSKDDILFSYWKLSARMRMTSGTLQRWMSSWISFTIIWLAKFVLIWLDHTTTYIELAQFALPLLLLLILCSAYGEANSECSRIIQTITPLQDRLDMIKALSSQPLGMTLYNSNLTYSGILTVIAAIGLALSSRIVLDEFTPPSPH